MEGKDSAGCFRTSAVVACVQCLAGINEHQISVLHSATAVQGFDRLGFVAMPFSGEAGFCGLCRVLTGASIVLAGVQCAAVP